MMNLISQDKIMSAISEVCATARTVESQIHLINVSTLDHIRAFGDYRGCLALLNALPKGQRVQAVAAWFREFSNGKITLRQDKNKVWTCDLKDRTDADFDMEGAEATTYAELTEEPKAKQMDLAALIKLVERAATNDKSLKDGTPKVTADARAQAARLVAFARLPVDIQKDTMGMVA